MFVHERWASSTRRDLAIDKAGSCLHMHVKTHKLTIFEIDIKIFVHERWASSTRRDLAIDKAGSCLHM